jgi:hypothetical protein
MGNTGGAYASGGGGYLRFGTGGAGGRGNIDNGTGGETGNAGVCVVAYFERVAEDAPPSVDDARPLRMAYINCAQNQNTREIDVGFLPTFALYIGGTSNTPYVFTISPGDIYNSALTFTTSGVIVAGKSTGATNHNSYMLLFGYDS